MTVTDCFLIPYYTGFLLYKVCKTNGIACKILPDRFQGLLFNLFITPCTEITQNLSFYIDGFLHFYSKVARKKKKKFTGTLTFILLVLTALAAGTWYVTSYLNRPKFVRYPAFGIDLPVNYSIHGIDVSRHQAIIDWNDVKAMHINDVKIGFGFMKATEGIESVDGRFRKNWFEAKKAGIPRGAYHFFNCRKSGKASGEVKTCA